MTTTTLHRTSQFPTSTTEIELSIVLPCLNEAETLEICLQKALDFLKREEISGEVIVADNGSADGSQEIAARYHVHIVNVVERGYGSAIYHGTLSARGRYIIMGDSDNSYDFSNLMPFLEKLRDDYDLVMGNRFLGGIQQGAMPWKNRWIGNPILSGIGRLFFRCPVGDFNCGLRGYSIAAFRALDLRTVGMEFASEMVIKSTLLGQRIAEVPTTLSPDGRSRPPHLRPWRDGWRHLRFMLLYSPRWLFLYPGTLLVLIGLIGCLRLVIGPLSVNGLVFDVQTLLFAAIAVLIGSQLLFFAIFSKMFAVAGGLLPADIGQSRITKNIGLEHGLVFGILLTIAGFTGSIVSLLYWRSHGFGELDARQALRIVIPAALSLALGVQVIFSSFLISILELTLRKGRRSAP